MKKYLANFTYLKVLYRWYVILDSQYNLGIKWLKLFQGIYLFLQEYDQYMKLKANENFSINKQDFSPYLQDKTSTTPLDYVYFLQDTWATSKIKIIQPKHHYDVGSSVKTMGIISQFIPVTMIDIRPVEVELNNFNFLEGSILNLPFEDNSIECISSLCVIEHIGLGRYGDALDPWGSEKGIKELKRVVKIGGIILISVPIDNNNKIYFNAHRAFTRDYILQLFKGCEVLDEQYQYGHKLYPKYDTNQGFGTGLFMFKKTA